MADKRAGKPPDETFAPGPWWAGQVPTGLSTKGEIVRRPCPAARCREDPSDCFCAVLFELCHVICAWSPAAQ